MKTFSVLATTALIGAGALTSTPSEARSRGGAVAAGLVGGLAAGALIGAAASNAYAAPEYGYRPVYYARPRRVVRDVVEEIEECRVVVRRRYNAFGDVVVRRTRICD
jgi:hypothetical protein